MRGMADSAWIIHRPPATGFAAGHVGRQHRGPGPRLRASVDFRYNRRPMDSKGRVVLSGIQPSGALHVGNYFGAVRQYLQLIEQGHRCLFFIANYHALIAVRNREELLRLTQDTAVSYVAMGLDPTKATLYRQSDIPEVCELQWLLTTVTPMGLLERCHAYKDK